jgi:tetratricopeptide (TPR) repeat protein
MLRTTGVLLLSMTLVLGCASSEKLLQRGQYEKAIAKSVKKLRKDPGNEKELYVLTEAYSKANAFDRDRISFLEKEGRSENYLEIYNLYQRLDNRQDRIKTLPTSVMNEFEIIDYDDQLIDSKEQAAEVSYQRGLEYLAAGDRESARMAFYEFERVRSIYPDYKDVLTKMEEAQYQGKNQVLFVIENNSEVILPERFDEELRKIGLSDLNGRWIQYSVYENEGVNYDYFIVLDIRDIAVSPERIDRESYTETAEIQDGMKYVLDERGNVKKDSLGNDIREPNMVTISAEITKARQWKEAVVGGSIDYLDLRTDQLVKTESISVTALFEHFSAGFSGDERALSRESERVIGEEIVQFPTNELMLMDSADLIKEKAKEIMYRNRGLLSSTES